MHESDRALFNDSLARCQRGGRFFQRFYELFLASSPEIRDKFHSTDIGKHRRKLRRSLYILVEHVAYGGVESTAYLERLAEDHSKRGRDIPPHLYDAWLECLLRAVKECDALYSDEVAAAWRSVLGAGILLLKSRYDRPDESREVPDGKRPRQ
jgi:hemoglobin-like flavoprotein